MFRSKQVVEQKMANGNVRSRFQQMLDHLNAAHFHLDQVAHLNSSLIVDAEKGMTFIDKFRRDLTQAIEETGAPIESNIEAEIAEFVPKNFKPAE